MNGTHTTGRRKPDQDRRGLTHRFVIGGVKGYATLNFYPDGRPSELFLKLAKQGSTLGGWADALAVAVSLGLQYGVPMEAFVSKFAGMSFPPDGFGPDGARAVSIVDYVFRWTESACARRKKP